MTHAQITAAMQQLGMAWAVRSDKYVDPNDPFGSKPTYHVHPDHSYPHQNSIKRFDNLAQVSDYVAADTHDERVEIMQDWYESTM